MEMTQKDYDERKARVDQGEGSDEDRRLVKLYEAEGFKRSPDPSPSEPVKAEKPETDPPTPDGGASSPGSSTPPSADPPPTSEQPSSGNRPSRARTTANPSK